MRTVETGGHTEYTPVGHVTNLAARMQTLAPAGAIAVSEDTRRLVEGYFELACLGTDRGQGSQRADQRLRGDRARAAARPFRAGGAARADEVRRPRARTCSRCGARSNWRWAGTDRSSRSWPRRAPASRGCSTSSRRPCRRMQSAGSLFGLARQGVGMAAGARTAAQLFRHRDGDDAAARREKVERQAGRARPGAADTLPYLFGLLGIQESPDPLAQMDPQIKRQRTLEAIKRIILRESLEHRWS